MQFDPSIHTKTFLLSNPDVAFELTEKSSEFAGSGFLDDFEILQISNNHGFTVAHKLAELEKFILSSKAANDLSVLKLQDNTGWSVAHSIVERYFDFDKIENIFHKEVLSLVYDGWTLAEYISDIYDDAMNLDVPTMAIKLIGQGAAYKHSKPIDVETGNILVQNFDTILEESDPLIRLKQIQAFYSTCIHNLAQMMSTPDRISIDKWKEVVSNAEIMFHQHLNANPELLDIEHSVDFYCEPGDDFLKKRKAELIFKENLEGLQNSLDTVCMEPIKPSFY
jgi:hypothetical protein